MIWIEKILKICVDALCKKDDSQVKIKKKNHDVNKSKRSERYWCLLIVKRMIKFNHYIHQHLTETKKSKSFSLEGNSAF